MVTSGFLRVEQTNGSVTFTPQPAVCPHCGKCRHCGQPSAPSVPYTPSPYPVMPSGPIWYWPNIVYC